MRKIILVAAMVLTAASAQADGSRSLSLSASGAQAPAQPAGVLVLGVVPVLPDDRLDALGAGDPRSSHPATLEREGRARPTGLAGPGVRT